MSSSAFFRLAAAKMMMSFPSARAGRRRPPAMATIDATMPLTIDRRCMRTSRSFDGDGRNIAHAAPAMLVARDHQAKPGAAKRSAVALTGDHRRLGAEIRRDLAGDMTTQ